MSSNYGYGYDQYSAYAGYATQYNMMATQQQQPQQQTTPSVGYGQTPRPSSSPNVYTGYQQPAATPTQQQQTRPQMQAPPPPPPPPPGTGTTPTQTPQYNYPQTGYGTSYQSYQSFQGYRPPATYPTYVPSQGTSSTTSYTNSQAVITSSSSVNNVSYPNYQTGYQMKQEQTNTQSQTGSYSQTTPVSYPQVQTVSYPQTYQQSYSYPQTAGYKGNTYQTGSYNQTSDVTPQQQRVIQQFVHQKTYGGHARNAIKKPKYQSSEEFYCDVCKIACGSPFAYKSHMAGKNHKKRVQQFERTKEVDNSSNPFRCDVCDVYCSNKDSFQAHIKGAKHIKTVNLFRKLGKPLPTMTSVVSKDDGAVQVTGPRITFVGGKKLSSTGLTINKEKDGLQVYPPGAPEPPAVKNVETTEGGDGDNTIEPVGVDLIKPIKGDPRNPHATFICEMCDCFFCDDLAKIIHCKGRRHRLNYKKMYQPTLKVEPAKAQLRQIEKKRQKWKTKKDTRVPTVGGGMGNGQGGGSGGGGGRGGGRNGKRRGGRGGGDNNLQRLRQQEAVAIAKLHGHDGDPYLYDDYYRGGPPLLGYNPEWGPGWDEPHSFLRNPLDDKLVSSKHGQLYPQDTELNAAQTVVETIEKALKSVSDDLLMEKCKLIAAEKGENTSDVDVAKDESLRQLKGVMRVGTFARGMLLKGQLNIELVLMCTAKPTKDLLHEMYEQLPAKFAKNCPDKIYHITCEPRKAGMTVVSSLDDHTVTVNLVLTSTLMREDQTPESIEADSKAGVLDRACCLVALAALRHTKWFQAMCQGLPSFSLIMRVFVDLAQRHPVWRVLDTWMLELLIQKCIVSANQEFTRPGDIFRRVIECIASGIFLPGCSGLYDPCEKGAVDAALALTAQERADLTLTAQHYLRLIAFNQLHLVLDVTPPENYAPYTLGKKDWNRELEEVEEGEGNEDGAGELAVKKMKTES